MSEIHRIYGDTFNRLKSGEGAGADEPWQDAKAEWETLLSDEWENWKASLEDDNFDRLEILDRMGFFDVLDEHGERVYSDDELQACLEDDEASEIARKALFAKEAFRRSKVIWEKDEYAEEYGIEESIEQTTRESVCIGVEAVDAVILPPDAEPRIESGSGGGVDTKEFTPRDQYLREILQELGLDFRIIMTGAKEHLSPETRKAIDSMVRNKSYTIFVMDGIQKAVYVNNEEGNATYILSDVPKGATWDSYFDSVGSKSTLKNNGDLFVVRIVKWPFFKDKKNDDEKRKQILWKERIMTVLQRSDGEDIASRPKSERKEIKVFLTLENLRRAVKNAGINSQSQYKKAQKLHPDWPSNPNKHYRDDWKDWYDLFGREAPKFLTLEELRTAVKNAGIISQPQYEKAQKLHPDWPSNPDPYYRDKWKNWPDLFGREAPKFLTLEELRTAVKNAGIISKPQYQKAQKLHPDWPSNPDLYYRDKWKNWPDLFGRKKVE